MLALDIDDELKAWIDPLSSDEYALLEASILQDGCRDPLVVWGTYLLDGHNRYEICHKHGIQFATVEKGGLVTKEDAKIWMIQNQLGKRNATDFVRATLALKLKPLIEARAKERMLLGRPDPVQNSAQGTGKSRDELAKVAGVSHDTVRKVEKIIEKATADVIEKVRAGELSINAAAKTVEPKREVRPPGTAPGTAVTAAPGVTLEHSCNAADYSDDDSGPSDAEVAAALADELAQAEYIKNLLANEDDPLTKALADVAQLRQLNAALKSQNDGYQSTISEQIRIIKSLRTKLAKVEVLERAA